MQSFEMRPEVQVVPPNVERLRLADGVPLAGQHPGIRLPVVGVKLLDRASCQLVAQLSARRVGAPPQDVSGDARGRAVEAVPAPALLRLIFDKRPEFIDLQVFDAWRHTRLTNCGGARADGFHHGLRADRKHARDIPDATTVHSHRHDQFTDEGLAGAISVVSDELTATIRALVLLFSVSDCAILFDVQ